MNRLLKTAEFDRLRIPVEEGTHPFHPEATYDKEISDKTTAGFSDEWGNMYYMRRRDLPKNHPNKYESGTRGPLCICGCGIYDHDDQGKCQLCGTNCPGFTKTKISSKTADLDDDYDDYSIEMEEEEEPEEVPSQKTEYVWIYDHDRREFYIAEGGYSGHFRAFVRGGKISEVNFEHDAITRGYAVANPENRTLQYGFSEACERDNRYMPEKALVELKKLFPGWTISEGQHDWYWLSAVASSRKVSSVQCPECGSKNVFYIRSDGENVNFDSVHKADTAKCFGCSNEWPLDEPSNLQKAYRHRSFPAGDDGPMQYRRVSKLLNPKEAYGMQPNPPWQPDPSQKGMECENCGEAQLDEKGRCPLCDYCQRCKGPLERQNKFDEGDCPECDFCPSCEHKLDPRTRECSNNWCEREGYTPEDEDISRYSDPLEEFGMWRHGQ